MESKNKAEVNFDISLILNLHNEASFLRRTMMSIEEAVRFTSHYGLTTEVIAVLDNPDELTKAWIENYNFDEVFDGHQITIVDNGSLGLSRNSGIELARGEYIATCDADDLISYNMFLELYLTAKSRGRHAIAMTQYLFAFGNSHHFVEYFGNNKVSKLGFFSYHPYISRIFAHKSLFKKLHYKDVGLKTGFAYEDWHFNCEALTLGYEFVIAKNTVFFYRQRQGSLLKSANAATVKCIPASNYFDPDKFQACCAYDYGQFVDDEVPVVSPQGIRDRFLQNPLCLELTFAANKIDPAVDIGLLETAFVFSNCDGDLGVGAAYFRCIKPLVGRKFTDVIILPYLSTGGAEKYILDILDGLSELDPSRTFLVLSGQKFDQHEWVERLPEGSVFLDLYAECEGCTDINSSIDDITFRLIQSVAAIAYVHLKSSAYGVRFAEKYFSRLPSNKFVYYRFSDPRLEYNGLDFERGFSFQFMSEVGCQFDIILTDNKSIANKDRALFDTVADRIHCLYAKCPIVTGPKKSKNNSRRKQKLLWASRLDNEKRVDLLLKLATKLSKEFPSLSISVYGSSVINKFDTKQFSKIKNIEYKGAYSGFDTIPHQNYDAFIYTTLFDGMPNVVLEALSAGLPVIAPDVGGIREAVIDGETGFLLENLSDDNDLLDLYVEAISKLYDKTTDISLLAKNGIELVKMQHSETGHLRELADIFKIAPKTAPKKILKNTKRRPEKKPIAKHAINSSPKTVN